MLDNFPFDRTELPCFSPFSWARRWPSPSPILPRENTKSRSFLSSSDPPSQESSVGAFGRCCFSRPRTILLTPFKCLPFGMGGSPSKEALSEVWYSGFTTSQRADFVLGDGRSSGSLHNPWSGHRTYRLLSQWGSVWVADPSRVWRGLSTGYRDIYHLWESDPMAS